MTDVSIPIFIRRRGGERQPLVAWERREDSPLACHPSLSSEVAWTITHRKTGLRVNPSETPSKEAALALIDLYAPLADWNAIGEHPDELAKLRPAIETAYQQFRGIA